MIMVHADILGSTGYADGLNRTRVLSERGWVRTRAQARVWKGRWASK